MRGKTSTMAERYLPRLPKLLSQLGLWCCQCTVSWECLQIERLGAKYYLKAYCAIFFMWRVTSVLVAYVCLHVVQYLCCLSNFLCREKSNHLTVRLPCDKPKERLISLSFLLFLWLFNSFPSGASHYQIPQSGQYHSSLHLFNPNETQCLMCRLRLSSCGRWSWSLLTEALAARIQQAACCFPPSLTWEGSVWETLSADFKWAVKRGQLCWGTLWLHPIQNCFNSSFEPSFSVSRS